MTKDEMSRIRDLVYQITQSSVKAHAETPLRDLRAVYHREEPTLDPYAKDKFRELISLSETASGQVRDKEHWVQVANQALAKFEMSMKI